MRTVLVVIPNEFRQHRPQVLLVEDDHVVQTFLAECPDNAFGNCVAQKLGTATTKLKASLTTASKTCRSMRNTNPTGFRNTYGTRSNAFAKCVVAHTK